MARGVPACAATEDIWFSDSCAPQMLLDVTEELNRLCPLLQGWI